MRRFVYGGWSERLWLSTTPEEIKMAKKFYKLCKKSKNKKEKLICDRPERIANAIGVLYFRFDNGDDVDWYETNRNTNGTKTLTVMVNKFNRLSVRNEAITNEIKRLKKQLQLGKLATTIDKVSAIHDYICDIAEYNYGEDAKGYAIYHVLFERTGICCGYAETFKAICDFVDVEVRCVGTDDHEWNEVKIGDEWLSLDVTWDDGDIIDRRYYLLPEKEFNLIHPVKDPKSYKTVWEIIS